MVKKISRFNVRGVRLMKRLWMGWMVSVKKILMRGKRYLCGAIKSSYVWKKSAGSSCQCINMMQPWREFAMHVRSVDWFRCCNAIQPTQKETTTLLCIFAAVFIIMETENQQIQLTTTSSWCTDHPLYKGW